MKNFWSALKWIAITSIVWLILFFFVGDYYPKAYRFGSALYVRMVKDRDFNSASVQKRFENLAPPFYTELQSMYDCKPQMGIDGELHKIECNVNITVRQGMAIYELCRKIKPKQTLEVGFANGYSTLYFLAAIKANGTGKHLALDPFEYSRYHGVGLQNVREVGMEESLGFREQFDFLALPDLMREGRKFEVIFVDGNHRFDDVLLGFTLSSYLCSEKGYIIFHDMWMPSIQRVVSFIKNNRPDYRRYPSPDANIAIFQKVGNDSRSWDHYEEF